MAVRQFRKDYPGEFVITKTIFRNGKKVQEREWIENPINNEHVSARAICVANGPSTSNFRMNAFETQGGGLLAKDKAQIYGVEDVWTRLNVDFLVSTNQEELDKIKEAGYQENHIVYTTASLCIKNPGEFYLIPYSVHMHSAGIAAWLACFDGHKEIYLFGYDEVDHNGNVQEKMFAAVTDVMRTYPEIQFIHVTDYNTPTQWKRQLNCEVMGVREFISYCDI